MESKAKIALAILLVAIGVFLMIGTMMFLGEYTPYVSALYMLT